MPLLRIIRTRGEVIVIVCDRELLGKTLRRPGMKLEVKESFYSGEEATVQECMKALGEASVANLVGSIVDHAIKAGIVNRRNVFRFQGVPHAQVVRM